jgi:hypothetical protein
MVALEAMAEMVGEMEEMVGEVEVTKEVMLRGLI